MAKKIDKQALRKQILELQIDNDLKSQLLTLVTDIAVLQKGELIIKDNTASLLGIGNKWKKIKVTHLI